ncbi:MAG: hypothetical protein R3C01_16430 [Planctomycetaceae bacterium]
MSGDNLIVDGRLDFVSTCDRPQTEFVDQRRDAIRLDRMTIVIAGAGVR